ncbi:hypothetical protein QOZ84_10205 [Romboutsia sedimentorum]|uniref:DUF3997 domain-containing protein n=1 Tax=Romboutsia sedimentorum TaxID=1368474 RepID=A0ABT7EAG8_9FIRM|nr:hypothetical protein [Romboutsia sedimentorum]MDK2563923.1 hypothetical protein [Romboutsia sedimentorum]
MKKSRHVISICLLMVILFICSQSDNKSENMTTGDNNDYVLIVWEGRSYVPFCVIDNSERGAQIGVVNGDKNDQVFEYKKHSTYNWIISFYKSGEMDNSMLIKEIDVTKIPNNLRSEYEWNNK